MNEQKIEELLRRYFDGATSLDEERELQRYFAESDIPDHLKAYRPMFAYFAEERTVMPPKPKAVVRNIRLGLSILTGVAASIAILFLVGLPDKQADHYVYFVDGQRVYNEAVALESAENKLQFLAASMQKAQNSMAAFGKVQDSSQALQQFDKISNAFQRIEFKSL